MQKNPVWLLKIQKIGKICFSAEQKLLERVYPENINYLNIKSFAKKRAKNLGVDLYELGGPIVLHSEGNIAKYEYEDGDYSVKSGQYSVNASLAVWKHGIVLI